MRRGDLVIYIEGGEFVYAVIARTFTTTDYDFLCIDRRCVTSRRMAQNCRVVPAASLTPQLAAVRDDLLGLLVSAQGKAALANSSVPAQSVLRRGKGGRLVSQRKTKDWPPTPGRGQLETYNEPDRIADNVGVPTHQMDAYCIEGAALKRELDWLERANKAHYDVFIAHARQGLTHVQIAALVGISEAAVQKRYQRAWAMIAPRLAASGPAQSAA